MTGDPGEQQDILGFGDADRGRRRPSRLILRLDRLALRVTRRPGLLAIAAGLVVVMLAAGGLTYAGTVRPGSRPAAAVPRAASGVTSACLDASQYKLLAAALRKIAEQAEHITGRPLASAGRSGTVVGYVTGAGNWTQFSITIPDPATRTGGQRCPS